MIKLTDLETVTMFVGLPGCGKTTIASAIAKKCLKKGIRVFSNVPIKGCLSYDWKVNFGNTDMKNSIIILDEAGLCLDNRSWEKNFDKAKVEFLKLLRHAHSKLVVFSQTWNDCDIKIRSMTSKLYIVKRSLIPFTTCAIPVYRSIGVDKETEEFKEIYRQDGFIFGIFTTRRCFRPLYYKMFDSWECPDYPSYVYDVY